MSTTFFSWTFPTSEHEAISSVTSLETASHVLSLLNEPESSLLMSASRNDWLLSNLEALARGFKLDRLADFHQVCHVIRVEEMPEFIAQVQTLLSAIATRPDDCAKLMSGGDSAEYIQRDFELAQPIHPSHLPPEYSDDGDSPRYLFAWIKSLLQLALLANVNSQHLIHVQPGEQRARDA